MKKSRIFLIITILMYPILVFATNSSDSGIDLFSALFMEAFVSIHMSVGVLYPLAQIISKDNVKQTFLKLFIARAAFLLFFDFFVTPDIAMVDFFAVFIGVFAIAIISSTKKLNITPFNTNQNIDSFNIRQNVAVFATNTQSSPNTEVILKCAKCGATIKVTDTICPNCRAPIEGDNITVTSEDKKLVTPTNYDPIYSYSEDQLLEEIIKKELEKASITTDNKLIPEDVLKRKNIMSIIFAILVYVYISLIFFHFPIYTYVIGIIIIIVTYVYTNKYNFMKYLKKEIKSRPSEKISNIVMNVKNSFIEDNSKKVKTITILAAIIIPLLIFKDPMIMYEKKDDGYAVRFYTFGLTNFKTATIPNEYKGLKVISLRGNAFSNMPFLKSVTLPDTITEIRGQAFKNDINLTTVNIPPNLEYLGGGSFYNCKSLDKIELPDTLTYMGGETFYKASSLQYVKLSKNLTEIRGDSFEYCTSLKSIDIPDKVTRIGGHAFYGDSSLTEVNLTPYSNLSEIGSSAFRLCNNLTNITIPRNTYVNERAFKESPTIVKRFGDEDTTNTYTTTKDIYGNNSMIKLYETVTFLDHNISVQLLSYQNNSGIIDGTVMIDFNDGIHNNIKYNFYSRGLDDIENDAISFTYSNYCFQIVNYNDQEIEISINKNTDYNNDYSRKVSYSFTREGELHQLPNSNHIIKLEKITKKNNRYDYLFSYDGVYFDKEIGNGYYHEADSLNNSKIQIESFYPERGIYLNVYYNY